MWDTINGFVSIVKVGITRVTKALVPKHSTSSVLDSYLYNAHKAIDGVPQFVSQPPVLSTCPTCIQAKQTKSAPGHHSTRVATQPYQGLSIDYGFSGMVSANSKRRKDYEGLNKETAWILVTDHFTGMKHGDTRQSKSSPIEWLRHFLNQYSPNDILENKLLET